MFTLGEAYRPHRSTVLREAYLSSSALKVRKPFIMRVMEVDLRITSYGGDRLPRPPPRQRYQLLRELE